MTQKRPNYPISDHYNGKCFFNPECRINKSFLDVVALMLGSFNTDKWPEKVINEKKPVLAQNLTASQCYVTYINHATHLIQLQSLNILTDPIFSLRASPFSFFGPKRVREPGIPLTELPPIDIILISHNHYDHMDIPSLVQLKKLFNPIFIVPLGNACYLNKHKIASVIELDWWQSYAHNSKQVITLLPAVHWSKRGFFDQNKALWGSFWIESENLKIYFAGDTGYGEQFKNIQEKLGTPDLSILPIGSFAPRWFMKPQHMNPEEAVLSSLDLKSPLNIATHHQTFRLSYEGYEEPLNDLKKSLQSHHIPAHTFLAPENGETVILNVKSK